MRTSAPVIADARPKLFHNYFKLSSSAPTRTVRMHLIETKYSLDQLTLTSNSVLNYVKIYRLFTKHYVLFC